MRKFIADRMLGKLAKYLRMLGMDTLYFTQNERTQLIELARDQERTVLSRDSTLTRLRHLPNFLFITEDAPEQQLWQVVDHFRLEVNEAETFSRCLRCNEILLPRTSSEVSAVVPPYILSVHQVFSFCPNCRKVYWKGTHQMRMAEMIRRLVVSGGDRPA